MSRKQIVSLLPVLALLLAVVLGCGPLNEDPPRGRGDSKNAISKNSGGKAVPSPSAGVVEVPKSTPGSGDYPESPTDVADSRRGDNLIVGRVVGVSDGDTITVLDGERNSWKVRLATIDSPEKNQDFGARAKESLSGLVFGREVEVEVRTVDRYGRNVGVVRIGGMDVNLEQIKRGFAWHYTQYSKEQPFDERRIYAQAQEEAQARRVGLWSQSNPIEPWSFRRGMRRGRSSAE